MSFTPLSFRNKIIPEIRKLKTQFSSYQIHHILPEKGRQKNKEQNIHHKAKPNKNKLV